MFRSSESFRVNFIFYNGGDKYGDIRYCTLHAHRGCNIQIYKVTRRQEIILRDFGLNCSESLTLY